MRLLMGEERARERAIYTRDGAVRNRLKRGVSPLRDDYTNDAHAAMHTRTGLTPDAPHRCFF